MPDIDIRPSAHRSMAMAKSGSVYTDEFVSVEMHRHHFCKMPSKSNAACGTLVPGPYIAATPCSYRSL